MARTELHEAARCGSIEHVRRLVFERPGLVRETDDCGCLPIHHASIGGQLSIVEFLLDRAPETIAVTDDYDRLPIHIASRYGHLSIVEFLADRAPETIAVADVYGELPIHFASWDGDLSIVEFLVERAPETIRDGDQYGYLPIHNASYRGHLSIVQLLVDRAPETAVVVTKCGETPLVMALRCNRASERASELAIILIPHTRPLSHILGLLGGVENEADKRRLLLVTISHHALTDAEWSSAIPYEFPELAPALPFVYKRSKHEASILVKHLLPEQRNALRAVATSLCFLGTPRHLIDSVILKTAAP